MLPVTEAPSVLILSQDLADDLSSELSGNFRTVVLGLLMLAPVYDASELRNAIKVRMNSRFKKKKKNPILCCLPNLGLHNNTSAVHSSDL